MTARFVVVQPHRGPHDPPELGSRVDWRPESAQPWWAFRENGELVARCSTMSAAQEALGGLERTEVK